MVAAPKGFNRGNVYHFFDIPEKIHKEHKFDATRISHIDESSFSTQ